MKIGGSGLRKTQRGVCSRAHGKWAGPIGYKLSRGEGGFWPVFGTAPLPTGTSVPSPRGEGDIYRPFGTVTLNRTTSGAGSRGEASPNQPQTGLLPMLRLDFGTASPAGGLSVASPRGEAVIYRLFVHKMPLFHGH